MRPHKPQQESVGGCWEMVESYNGGSLNQGGTLVFCYGRPEMGLL